MSLPLNFHRTFIPERRLISALLDYAAQGKSGTFQEIASETGIPMGKSTGKVPAILDYAQGMGLVIVQTTNNSSIRKPLLTDFGRVVYLEDRMMGEVLTQWIAHLHLCLPDKGAKAWYLTFGKGRTIIGQSFTRDQLNEYLISKFGPGKRRIGPLVRTYLDDAALGRAHVLTEQNGNLVRHRAPLIRQYSIAYAAFMINLMESFFADVTQVTVSDLNKRSYFFDSCLWGTSEVEAALSLIEKTGFISVDRQIRPWIIERKSDPNHIWPSIYDELA